MHLEEITVKCLRSKHYCENLPQLVHVCNGILSIVSCPLANCVAAVCGVFCSDINIDS